MIQQKKHDDITIEFYSKDVKAFYFRDEFLGMVWKYRIEKIKELDKDNYILEVRPVIKSLNTKFYESSILYIQKDRVKIIA